MKIYLVCKTFLRNLLPRKFIRKIRHFRRLWVRLNAIEKNEANLLREKYKGIGLTKRKMAINSHEFSVHSQHGEDGIIAHIFSKIGVVDGTFVEFGSGGERGCNSSNLAINFGWRGLFIDGEESNVLDGIEYYSSFPQVKPGNVKFAQNWITKENINSIIKDNGFEGEIDLLSIDIDGNDYHIFNALNIVKPRVIILEYNALLGKEKQVTIKYDPKLIQYGAWYCGASLNALTKLANKKGYILVGCESRGSNAFYIREDVAKNKFKEVEVGDAFYPKPIQIEMSSQKKQSDMIKYMEKV